MKPSQTLKTKKIGKFKLHHLASAVCLGLSVGFAIGFSSTGLAASDSAIDNLNQLVTNRQFVQAYELSKQMMNEYEGDPQFDFLFGTAAMEAGHPNEAVFAFERIVFVYPEQQRVKLELARAFFQNNNLPAARRVFNEVLATNPTENVRNNVQAFIDRIDERENTIAGSFGWYVSSNIGTDSNINSATELGVISTPIGDVELSANGQKIDDNFMDLGTGLSYVKPLSKTSAVNFNASYNNHNNLDTNDFDIDVLALDMSYAHLVKKMKVSYGARAQQVQLDGEQFQKSGSLITSIQRNGTGGWSQAITGAYTAVRYDNGINPSASLRDVNQLLVSGIVGKSTGRFNHTVSIYAGDEQERNRSGRDKAQRFYGIALSEQFQFLPGHTPYLRMSYHSSENKALDVVFKEIREDDTFSTSLGWVWQAQKKMNITTDVTYTNNDSTGDLYSYDRLKVQTGLRYQF